MSNLIIYNYFDAPKGHAQEVMEKLGIKYQMAIPQSISDSWHFWNCENIPDPLPSYLKIIDVDPDNFIGLGLSKEKAKEIKNYKLEETKQ